MIDVLLSFVGAVMVTIGAFVSTTNETFTAGQLFPEVSTKFTLNVLFPSGRADPGVNI